MAVRYPSKHRVYGLLALGGSCLGLTIFTLLMLHGSMYIGLKARTPVVITFVQASPVSTDAHDVLASEVMVSQFRTGASLTQDTFEYGSNSAAVSAGRTLMLSSTYFLNVHLMGFGPGDPEPSPGTYSWNSLDTRINTNMAGGSGIVLTGCCAPSWMKGGASDFGSGFEVAPTPDYYDDYANLVAAAVARYPQIQYVQVWNEMKGFWNSSQNRWNYEGYTDLYNQVWTKVKAVRSSVKIGGPYVVLSSNGASHSYNSSVGGTWGKFDQRDLDVVTYWLQHKAGADFITVDGKNSNKDGTELVDAYTRSDKFQAAVSWIRSQPGSGSLPIWWAEWYGKTGNDADSQAYKNAVLATGLIRTLKSGVDTALIWGPEGDSAGNYQPMGLFNNTYSAGGGTATPFYTTQKYLYDYFSSGTGITNASSSNANIELLASSSKLLLANKTASSQTTQVLGASFTLGAYEVALKDAPATGSSSSGGGGQSGSSVKDTASSDQTNSSSANLNQPSTPTASTTKDNAKSKSALNRAINAFNDTTPIKIGSLKVPARTLRYISLLIFLGSITALIVLQRRRLQLYSRQLVRMFNHLVHHAPSNQSPTS